MAKLGREDGEIMFEQVCFHAQLASEEDVTEAIELAENFLAWARDQLRL